MNVDEHGGPRFELALRLFVDDGEPLSLDGVHFSIDEDGALDCQVTSTWALNSITEQTAKRDLAHGEHVLRHLQDQHPDFATAVANRPKRMVLIHDYGGGCVEVCELVDGQVVWAPGRA